VGAQLHYSIMRLICNLRSAMDRSEFAEDARHETYVYSVGWELAGLFSALIRMIWCERGNNYGAQS